MALAIDIELMQGACHFPIIIDYFRIIISVGHFECIITVTHNTFYNSQLVFLEVKWEYCYKYYLVKMVFLCDLPYIDLENVSSLFYKIDTGVS